MGYKILISGEAKTQLDEFLFYYVSISADVAGSFLKDVNRSLEVLKVAPEMYRVRYSNVRRFNFKIFPVMFLYTFKNDEVVILQVWHHKSNVDYFR